MRYFIDSHRDTLLILTVYFIDSHRDTLLILMRYFIDSRDTLLILTDTLLILIAILY